MRRISFVAFVTLTLIATLPALPASAQAPDPEAAALEPTAPVKSYKPVTIALPTPLNDPSLAAFRNKVADAAKKKDRAALAKLVVSSGFFWDSDNGDAADKKSSGIDNFAVALGLTRDGPGWDVLAGYAEGATVSPSANHKAAMCSPAEPAFDGQAMAALIDSTQTDASDWGYPVQNGVEVRAAPQSNAPVAEKLGLHFVRVMPDTSPAAAVGALLRIVTPSGKVGFVPADSIAPLGNDQLCYVKEAGAWKIGGYIGGGDSQ